MTHEQMRAQTEAYIEAVYAAHPELDWREEVITDFDPYPLISTADSPSIMAVAIGVARKHRVSLSDIRGESRHGEVMKARVEAMVTCALYCKQPIAAVGRFFNRDHTTVLHHLKKHKGRAA